MNLYAIHFDDGRVKVGITGNVIKRMRYFAQEARRNRVSGLTWFAASGFDTKGSALMAERVLCGVLADEAMPGHREWMEGDPKYFDFVIRAAIQLRDAVCPGADDRDLAGRVNFTGCIGNFGPRIFK